MSSPQINLNLSSNKLLPLYQTPHAYRFWVFRGGRGSGKSYSVAQYLITLAYTERNHRILCVREYQSNLKQSVYALVKQVIDDLQLSPYFEVLQSSIRCRHSNSEFIFEGLQNIDGIKSMAGITAVWAEEAATITKNQWDILIPTIRTAGSRFYICYNPYNDWDYTHTYFGNSTSPDTLVLTLNYNDNRYFPQVLEQERVKASERDYSDYLWVWEGHTRTRSDAQIFKNRWRVEAFDEQNSRNRVYRYGLDFGFSVDPTAGVRSYIEGDILYITHDFYATQTTLDELPQYLDMLPNIKQWPVYCDNSRPDSIVYLRKLGYRCVGAEKGKGSIEDGIEWLKSLKEIVIHPRCTNTINEFNRYSYKRDRVTDQILPVIEDNFNHVIDSIRYSYTNEIKSVGIGSFLKLAV